MKIDTKKEFTNLAGSQTIRNEKENPVTLGDVIGNILVNYEAGEKMKCFELAQNLTKESEVNVDTSDLNLIKDAIEKTKLYNNLITGQALLMLEKIGSKES